MASAPSLNIDQVAGLARLALTADERAHFGAQLREVLIHIEQLKQVDVTGVEPMAHAFPLVNVWGEDLAEPGLPRTAALRNAPVQRDGMIVVPKVVE